jgi:hypothetical protein
VQILTCLDCHSLCQARNKWLRLSDHHFHFLFKKWVFVYISFEHIVLITRAQLIIYQQYWHVNICAKYFGNAFSVAIQSRYGQCSYINKIEGRFILFIVEVNVPITVAARSRAWTVFSPPQTLRSCVRISLEARMSVCVLFCVCVFLCAGSDLATGWSPVQGVL